MMSRSGEQPRTAWLDPQIGTVTDISAHGSTMVVIARSTSASHVNVVSAASSASQDFFRCYFPSVSPDGRLIVFQKFVPRTIVEPPVLLVYDVELPPTANRMEASPRDESAVNAGLAFYPMDYKNTQVYRLDPEPADIHNIASPLTWIDAKRLVFLDRSESAVSVRAGGFHTRCTRGDDPYARARPGGNCRFHQGRRWRAAVCEGGGAVDNRERGLRDAGCGRVSQADRRHQDEIGHRPFLGGRHQAREPAHVVGEPIGRSPW